jgi:hypothetical protein
LCGWNINGKEPKVVFWGPGNILEVDLSIGYTGVIHKEITEHLRFGAFSERC